MVPKRTILRLGSITSTKSIARHNKTKPSKYKEINTAEACRICGNKITMKSRFTHGKIKTAPWFIFSLKGEEANIQRVSHYLKKWKRLIIKHKFSSKGNGIYFIETLDDFKEFLNTIPQNTLKNYIIEKYYTYSREYRIHVTRQGCFLADRKMLKSDAEVRWHRHADNSIWISDDNPLFNKPDNWEDIILSCVNALKSVNLDIGAVDVKIQSKEKTNPDWVILEINSAPALGEKSVEKYKNIILKLINNVFF